MTVEPRRAGCAGHLPFGRHSRPYTQAETALRVRMKEWKIGGPDRTLDLGLPWRESRWPVVAIQEWDGDRSARYGFRVRPGLRASLIRNHALKGGSRKCSKPRADGRRECTLTRSVERRRSRGERGGEGRGSEAGEESFGNQNARRRADHAPIGFDGHGWAVGKLDRHLALRQEVADGAVVGRGRIGSREMRGLGGAAQRGRRRVPQARQCVQARSAHDERGVNGQHGQDQGFSQGPHHGGRIVPGSSETSGQRLAVRLLSVWERSTIPVKGVGFRWIAKPSGDAGVAADLAITPTTPSFIGHALG